MKVDLKIGKVDFSFVVHRVTVAVIASVILALVGAGSNRAGGEDSTSLVPGVASPARTSVPCDSASDGTLAVRSAMRLLIDTALRELAPPFMPDSIRTKSKSEYSIPARPTQLGRAP